MFTIMHISDLHRSPIDPISNNELLSTLVIDKEHYTSENPSIKTPDIIVISGDLIQGAPLGDLEFEKTISEQYEKAYDFLNNLSDRFLNGDNSKLVITPGNHDIDWNLAFKSMTEIDPSNISTPLFSALTRKASPFRWCWKTRKLYKITDFGLYESRFDKFREFYKKIYNGVKNKPVEINPYCNLHKFNDDRIFIAAFNSCDGNDCFSNAGCIPEDAIANCHLFLHDNKFHNSLLIAVWHHNIEGPPLTSDYMDIDTVRRLISKGFRIGLHGHQHKSQAVAHSINLPQEENIVLVASGSLCAGHYELPVGTFRQYNIVEISDSYSKVRVHVREMKTSTAFSPSTSLPSETGSYLDMQLKPIKDALGRPIDINQEAIDKAIFTAEEKYNNGDLDMTVKLLLPIIGMVPTIGRKLLFNSLLKLNRWKDIIKHFQEPQSVEELLTVVKSFANEKRFPEAIVYLQKWSKPLNLPDIQRQEAESWLLTLQEI